MLGEKGISPCPLKGSDDCIEADRDRVLLEKKMGLGTKGMSWA